MNGDVGGRIRTDLGENAPGLRARKSLYQIFDGLLRATPTIGPNLSSIHKFVARVLFDIAQYPPDNAVPNILKRKSN